MVIRRPSIHQTFPLQSYIPIFRLLVIVLCLKTWRPERRNKGLSVKIGVGHSTGPRLDPGSRSFQGLSARTGQGRGYPLGVGVPRSHLLTGPLVPILTGKEGRM